MRISDWSSDVCSSDLDPLGGLTGAVDRGAVAHLDLDEERALVLARQEAGRGAAEQFEGAEADQPQHDEAEQRPPDDHPDHGGIAVAGAVDRPPYVAPRAAGGPVRPARRHPAPPRAARQGVDGGRSEEDTSEL